MLISDAHSRSPLDGKADQHTLRVIMLSYVQLTTAVYHRYETPLTEDTTLTALRTVITAGWPENKATLPPPIAVYFNYRDEPSIQDGIVLRGESTVIPQSLRADMKRRIHSGHLGIDSCYVVHVT